VVAAALVLPLLAGCSDEEAPASPRCEGPDTAAAVRVSRHFDGSLEGIRALAALPDGAFLAAGSLGDERPPASDAPAASGGRPTIARLDTDGAILERRDFSDGTGVVHALARGADGALFMAGSTGDASITLKNVLENEPAGSSYFPTLGFAARLDPTSFEPLWDFGLPGEFDQLNAVADTSAGVVVGGRSRNPSERKPDAYLAGLDRETGAVRWEIRIVLGTQGHVAGLGALPSGDVVAAIHAYGNVLAGVSAPLPAVGGTLLLALDPATGAERWAKILGDGSEAGSSLFPGAFAVAADGTLALGGETSGELDLGLGEVPSGGIALRLDAQGSPLEQHTFSSDQSSWVRAVAFDAGGGLLAAGAFGVGDSGAASLNVDGSPVDPTVGDTSTAGFLAGFSPSGAVRFGHVLPAVDNVQPGDNGIVEATAVAPGPGGSVTVAVRLSGVAHLASCNERSSEQGDAVLLRLDP
jgi:hypothetical protein